MNRILIVEDDRDIAGKLRASAEKEGLRWGGEPGRKP